MGQTNLYEKNEEFAMSFFKRKPPPNLRIILYSLLSLGLLLLLGKIGVLFHLG